MQCRIAIVIFGFLLLTGCVQLEVKETNAPGSEPEQFIIADLVNVLMQLDGYHPEVTRLQMLKPKDTFGKLLNDTLATVGYEIQLVQSNKGDRFVSYTLSKPRNSKSGAPKTYKLSVGDIDIKRDYSTSSGRLMPVSYVYVRGADPSSVTLNDHIFKLDHLSDRAPALPSVTPATRVSVDQNTAIQHVNAKHDQTVQAASPIELFVNGSSIPDRYNEGDELVFTIKAQEDVRLSCYYQDPDGVIFRMYPNRFSTRTNLDAGSLLRIPATDQWRMEATRAGASDEVMCVSLNPVEAPIFPAIESIPDFKPLPVSSFDHLLSEIKLSTGITPQDQRLSIHVE